MKGGLNVTEEKLPFFRIFLSHLLLLHFNIIFHYTHFLCALVHACLQHLLSCCHIFYHHYLSFAYMSHFCSRNRDASPNDSKFIFLFLFMFCPRNFQTATICTFTKGMRILKCKSKLQICRKLHLGHKTVNHEISSTLKSEFEIQAYWPYSSISP